MTEATPENRDSLVRKAYTNANSILRDRHKDEFLELHQAEAKKLGLDWTPRKTKEQKAREQMGKLLNENPTLREELMAAARTELANQQAAAPQQ